MAIRLLDAWNIGTTKEFIGSDIPPYAILSHAWEDEEVTYQQLGDPKSKFKKGYRKIEQTCALAAQAGLRYAWVDTCCIDKSSSAELSEAINSMFYWYQQAKVCYVYLSDLPAEADLSSTLPRCRCSWTFRDNKEGLSSLIDLTTGIPRGLLLQVRSPSDYPVARRMSWASQRQTTRIEDMSYCLLGLFDVHMSPRYGERETAFARLQNAILIQSIPDATIFAWVDSYNTCPPICGMLADSPRRFMACGSLAALWGRSIYRPLRTTHLEAEVDASLNAVLVGISVRKIGPKTYARSNPRELVKFKGKDYIEPSKEPVTLANTLPKRYPFYFGEDPILGYRFAALMPDIVVNKRLMNSDTQFVRKDLRYIPFSHWDRHDTLFISNEGSSLGWSMLSFQLELVSSNAAIKHPVWREDFSVACFRWNMPSEPILAIIRHSSINPVNLILLQSQLASLEFRSAHRAEDYMRRLCGSDIASSVTVHIPTTNFKGLDAAEKPITAPVVVSLRMKRTDKQDLCYFNLVKVLEIRVDPLSEGDCGD
ncbi:vegetative incompatibility protein HET-E-1 [Podospora aff. communis PSN243]|uniref:Vegetative incompatibility protein HET-E-1 n=1 Tax=Podospora aff. communis PSN243 TaxID=3040156 RepID=A0AAV9GXP6_9PEZI|nr:vegetative incompatibility protein HET-E-1 [Podospora aff. communis PSN243]